MRLNDVVGQVIDSPITQSREWAATWRGSRPLIDVSQAAPGYPPAEALREHLSTQVHEPNTATYTDQLGISELRRALADRVARQYQASIDSGQVAITAGCNQAFCMVAMAIAERGDEVLLPVPYYFNHDMWLRALGLIPVYVPCDQGMLPDVEAAAAAINRRTRAIVLVSPNNPSGAVCPAKRITQLYELAREHDLALIVDETYRDFRDRSHQAHQTHQGHEGQQDAVPPPHDLLSKPDWAKTVVQLYSFSKAYCLTGYRVGAITASPKLIREVAKLIDCVTICPSNLSQRAALYALEHLDDWKREKAEEIGQRMQLFREATAEARCPFRIASSGAYFAYVEHPFVGESATAVARRLAADHGILGLPGEMFGPGQERFLRLAFANLERDSIRDLVVRLCDAARDIAAANIRRQK